MSTEQGNVLLVTQILMAVVAATAVFGLESAFLQLRMSQNFKTHQQGLQAALEQLNQAPLTECYQFVPDTLHFGETQGTCFYRLLVNEGGNSNSRLLAYLSHECQRQ